MSKKESFSLNLKMFIDDASLIVEAVCSILLGHFLWEGQLPWMNCVYRQYAVVESVVYISSGLMNEAIDKENMA